MQDDLIIKELRAIRKSTDARYKDVNSYYRHLRRYQQRFKRRLVSRPPQPALTVKVL